MAHYKNILLALGLMALASTPLYAVETHGYLRSGIGGSADGADQNCFKAPGAEAKARLGNECETYIELTLAETYKTSESSKALFRGQVTLALASAGHKNWEGTGGSVDKVPGGVNADFTLALVEAYVEASKVLGEDAKIWIGKRYYRRHDIHMLDYYYLAHTGPMAGVEDINILPNGKLHLAVSRQVPDSASDAPIQTNFDLRVTDIKFFADSKLQLAVIYGTQGERGNSSGEKKFEKQSGLQTAVIYTQPTPIGNNTLVVQSGTGLFGANVANGGSALGDFGAYGSQAIRKGEDLDADAADANAARKSATKKSETFRLIEHLAMDFTPKFNGEFVILYQDVDYGGAKTGAKGAQKAIPNRTELTIGVRPVYHFTENLGLAFEAAHTGVDNAYQDLNGDSKDARLQKYTLAPLVTPGMGYWDRPQLRFFATYAKWDDDSRGKVGGSQFANNTDGFTYGAQVEAWW